MEDFSSSEQESRRTLIEFVDFFEDFKWPERFWTGQPARRLFISFDFLDFSCFVIGLARGPRVWEPMDFHQISLEILRKMSKGTKKVHKTTAK